MYTTMISEDNNSSSNHHYYHPLVFQFLTPQQVSTLAKINFTPYQLHKTNFTPYQFDTTRTETYGSIQEWSTNDILTPFQD